MSLSPEIPIPTGEPVTGLGGSEAIAGSVTSEFPDGHLEAEQQTESLDSRRFPGPKTRGYNSEHRLLGGYPADVPGWWWPMATKYACSELRRCFRSW